MLSITTPADRRIILVRHGESTSNRDETITGRNDPSLTKIGKNQAKRASLFIKNHWNPIDALYCSPLMRALHTARIVSKKIHTAFIEDDLLVEANFGKWEGSTRNELMRDPQWIVYQRDPFHFHFPGGESPQDVRKRVQVFIEKLFSHKEWHNIVIVTHYTPIVFFILTLIGNGNDSRASFRIDNASISVMNATEGSGYIELLNYIP